MIEDGYTRYDNVIATPKAISGGLGSYQDQEPEHDAKAETDNPHVVGRVLMVCRGIVEEPGCLGIPGTINGKYGFPQWSA